MSSGRRGLSHVKLTALNPAAWNRLIQRSRENHGCLLYGKLLEKWLGVWKWGRIYSISLDSKKRQHYLWVVGSLAISISLWGEKRRAFRAILEGARPMPFQHECADLVKSADSDSVCLEWDQRCWYSWRVGQISVWEAGKQDIPSLPYSNPLSLKANWIHSTRNHRGAPELSRLLESFLKPGGLTQPQVFQTTTCHPLPPEDANILWLLSSEDGTAGTSGFVL